MTPELKILCGDVLTELRKLPDESVQTCVTSPPYWALRSYLARDHPDKSLEIGSEATPEDYVKVMVKVFAEVRRVLRSDGTLWLNLGDCYCQGPKGNSDPMCAGYKQSTNVGSLETRRGEGLGQNRNKHLPGLKPKDMVMIPQRVAMALQADGWWLRSQIPWIKRNPMPESCEDRPAAAVEYVFLLTKSPRPFYDGEAVKVKASPKTHARVSQVNLNNQPGGSKQDDYQKDGLVGKKSRDRSPMAILRHMAVKSGITPKSVEPGQGTKSNDSYHAAISAQVLGSRNWRNSDAFFESWQGLYSEDNDDPLAFVVNPCAYSEAHFATFAPKLVQPCILAGTSSYGACAVCGAPWERIIEAGKPLEDWKKQCGADRNGEYNGQNQKNYQAHLAQPASTVKARILAGMVERKTVSWQPTCECHGKLVKSKRLHVPDTSTWNQSPLHEGKTAEQKHNIGKNRDPKEHPCWTYEPNIPLDQHPVVPCTVLDPFLGSGTTAQVALELGRHCIGIELNAAYLPLIRQRCQLTPSLPLPL